MKEEISKERKAPKVSVVMTNWASRVIRIEGFGDCYAIVPLNTPEKHAFIELPYYTLIVDLPKQRDEEEYLKNVVILLKIINFVGGETVTDFILEDNGRRAEWMVEDALEDERLTETGRSAVESFFHWLDWFRRDPIFTTDKRGLGDWLGTLLREVKAAEEEIKP